ncbi:unnamed protein product [Mytilus coruscus]|uniref:HAT C-terminal dimerisation domain-containing protein n=1 Tax=Mytilus coruscus TaxID=42192 RepID=A0A6J8CTM4_MYTCO|nr:unnamed protein product [Mytilus coruscus]
MKTLLRTFLGKFVKAKLIQTTPDLTTLDYSNPENQLPNSIISIRPKARGYLSVRQFYCVVVKKMVTKFPFNDPVVLFLAFLNPAERGNLDFNDTLKIDTDTRVDSYWAAVSAMTNKITRTARFLLLTRVTRAIYFIPNSNADCERVFSMPRRYTQKTGHHWTTL